jgi:Ca2+/Na+ antiporter
MDKIIEIIVSMVYLFSLLIVAIFYGILEFIILIVLLFCFVIYLIYNYIKKKGGK